MRELTDEEKQTFDLIQNSPDILLIQVEYKGQDTAAIAAVGTTSGGDRFLTPLALIVTNEMFEDILPPDGAKCAECGGLLEYSDQEPQAGMVHIEPADDTHAPRLV